MPNMIPGRATEFNASPMKRCREYLAVLYRRSPAFSLRFCIEDMSAAGAFEGMLTSRCRRSAGEAGLHQDCD